MVSVIDVLSLDTDKREMDLFSKFDGIIAVFDLERALLPVSRAMLAYLSHHRLKFAELGGNTLPVDNSWSDGIKKLELNVSKHDVWQQDTWKITRPFCRSAYR